METQMNLSNLAHEGQNAPANVKYNIVKRLSTQNGITDESEKERVKKEEKAKCSVRAKVEHAFNIIKNTFGFRKTRYKGGRKNDCNFHMLFALANIYKLRSIGISLLRSAKTA